jgi:hypothetical protein
MKIVACCLLAALVATTGCVYDHGFLHDEQPAKGPSAATAAERTKPPMTEDQVTPANAHAATQALREEMDREAATTIQPAPCPSCADGCCGRACGVPTGR